MLSLISSMATVTIRHPSTGEARRESCPETNRQVAKLRRMPRSNAVIDGFAVWRSTRLPGGGF